MQDTVLKGKEMKRIITVAVSLACLCLSGYCQEAASFPYPTVPDTLRTVEGRAEYVVTHYWDKFNFGDTVLIRRPEITEQGFANFLDLLPRVDSALAVRGVKLFVGKAFAGNVPGTVRKYFAEKTDHYLYDIQSPMCNDALYALFVSSLQHCPTFDIAERERYAFRLRNVVKNQPGTVATDFAYTDRKGQRSTLLTTPGEYTVVYFNDPDCENCHRITEQLRRDSILGGNAKGRITVLAIYPGIDTDEWRRHSQPFPTWWIDAYSPEGEIETHQLYFLRANPTIYLLDKDKRVILKDPSPEKLFKAIRSL